MSNICFSGGARGSDLAWGNFAEGRGDTVIHFSFEGHQEHVLHRLVLNQEQLDLALPALERASKNLKRSLKGRPPFVMNLLKRNWYQVKNTDSIYAVGTIIDNKVTGGTAWAVQMAIDRNVGNIFFFDQLTEKWYLWNNFFFWVSLVEDRPPPPSGKWTGIGTRELSDAGRKAILELDNKEI